MRGLTLYQTKVAATETIPIGRKEQGLLDIPPGRIVVSILYDLCNAFEVRPSVYCAQGSRIVSVLFHSVCMGCDELSARYGELAAAASEVWPFTISGTTADRENASLRFIWNRTGISFEMSSVSGKEFDHIEGLCLEWCCPDTDTAHRLSIVLSRLTPHLKCFGEHRGLSDFLQKNELSIPFDGAFFCYVPLDDEELCAADYTGCLSLEQKAALWGTFLEDGFCPLEFDWLFQQLERDNLHDYLEWEFALEMTMERLGFSVVNAADGFWVEDGQGHRRRFDYRTGSVAEKMFLKILFPVTLRI